MIAPNDSTRTPPPSPVLAQGISHDSLHRMLTEQLPLPMLIHVAGTIKYINQACVRLLGGTAPGEFIDTFIAEVIHPDYHAEAFDRVTRIMRGEPDVPAVELKLIRRDGQETWIETTGVPVDFDGQSAIYVIGLDITDRKRVQVQEQKRLADLETLYLLSNAVAGGDHLETLYEVAMDAAWRVLGSQRQAVLLFDDEGQARCVAARGLSDSYRQSPPAHAGWTPSTVNPQAWFIDNVADCAALAHWQPVARREGIGAMGILPLVQHGHLIGQFIIHFDDAHRFSTTEQQLAQTLAFHVALGVERKQSEAEIYSLAFFDPLTKLPNRRRLYDSIRQAMALSARSQQHGAVIFIDLDYFKTLNDTKGHDIGDLLLCQVARRLQGSVRELDTVSRLGGDEFVVLLEALSSDPAEAATQAEQVAQKIRVHLSQAYRLQQHDYHSTPSLGIALFRGHEESIDTLLRHADIAMYQAKSAGRNAVRFYDMAMQAKLEERLDLENDLHQALAEGQFQLHYQIQVDQAQRVQGVEALLRWPHPQRGMVSPAAFIALAEETGLIVPIGQWVMRTACAQIKAWSADPRMANLRVAVNVSSVQFKQDDFVGMVEQALREADIPPDRLKLELTESLMLENVDLVIAKMRQLNALGVGFSMDDFGTGFSSLSYLKKLPLEQVKIDQSFVHDVDTDPNDKAIVQAIVTMGEAFNLNIIAEGVETANQCQQLSHIGCAHYQGYLFGKPMPIGPLEAMLATLEVSSGSPTVPTS